MNDEYRPTMDELIESYAYSGDGSDFKAAMWARSAAAYELLTAHDAEIRRDQAERDARIATRGLRHWEPVNSDYEPSPKIATAIRAQFTPSPETERENTQ